MEKEGIAKFDVIDGFVLENEEKLKRAIEGEPARSGQPVGGLLEKYGELENIPPQEVLAHYDKLGGYISKGIGGDTRVKIKNGAFWDRKKKRPRGEAIVKKDKEGNEKTTFAYKPQIMYVFKVGGNFVEVEDPSDLAKAITKVENAVAENAKKNQEKRERARKRKITK